MCVGDCIKKKKKSACETEEKYKIALRDNRAHWSFFSCAFPVLQDVHAQQIIPAVPAGGWLNEEVSSPGSVCSFPAPSSILLRQTAHIVTTTVLLSG